MKPQGVNPQTGEIIYSKIIDPRYYNVSVECTDYAPITLEDLYARIEQQGGTIGFKSGNGPIM